MRRKIALGIVLALGVIVAGAVGAITVSTFNILDLIGVASSPGNPSSGKGRIYYSTADSKLHCLTSSGGDCSFGGGGGGGTPGGSTGDIQFKSSTGTFTNAAGIQAANIMNLDTSGNFTASMQGFQEWDAVGDINFDGAALNLRAESGDILFTSVTARVAFSAAGDVILESTGGNTRILADSGTIQIQAASGVIQETVADASPVTPGSVTQRAVTSSPDTILNTDRGNRVVYNSASSVAVTLPQAGSTGFGRGYNTRVSNQNAGVVTITGTVSTINGQPTLVLQEGQFCFITPSSAGTDWAADCGESQITAGANISLTRGVHSLTIGLTGLSPAPQTLSPTTNLFVSGYTQSTGAWTTSQVTGNSTNGAASTPAFQLTGTPFAGGTASTNFGFFSINPSTASAITGYSTNGEMAVINVPSTVTGRAFSIWNNGGANPTFAVTPTGGVTSAGSINSAAGSSMGPTGRSQLRSAADGRIALNNSANGSLGLTRFTLGTEAATNPAACPLSTIWDVCDGAGTTTFGNTTLLSANGNKVFVTSNFTTAANTNLQAITGLTFNFPAVAHNWEYTCDLSYSQATANAAVAFGIQAATNAPTNIYSTGIEQITAGPPATIVTGTLATLTTTTATNIVSGTPGATATNYTVHLAGMLELGASANAVSIMVSTATSGDAVTVLRGSSCRLF